MICLETVVVRGKIDCCDHLFCHECIVHVEQAGRAACPGCRAPFASIEKVVMGSSADSVPAAGAAAQKSLSLADADDSLSSCSSASDSDEDLPDFRTRVLNQGTGKGKGRAREALEQVNANANLL